MVAKRRKMEPVEAPQTLDEAIARIQEYVSIEAQLEQLDNDQKLAIANIKGTADATAKPLEQRLKGIVSSLRNWWAVAADAMTDGKTRSTELAGCKIGMRMTPPKVVCAGARSDADMLLKIEGDELLDCFIRRAPSVDKEAIQRLFYRAAAAEALDAADRNVEDFAAIGTARRLKALGFSLKQVDEFFIDRPKAPTVEKIDEPVREAA